jgi:hypothetical protein
MSDGSGPPKIDIIREINQRSDLAEKGLCSYCGRDPSTPICRVPAMHVLPLIASRQHDE